jgi:hypothetical protein
VRTAKRHYQYKYGCHDNLYGVEALFHSTSDEANDEDAEVSRKNYAFGRNL